ncbi:transporter [Pseudomonas sp. Pf153]|uniref:SphA family protein n=1 Tax=Pseudomonas sp. Pf153 TaxID=1699309 RepID=UPI00069D5D95|nr:transporter [Pseudomonas sp. Pf153]
MKSIKIKSFIFLALLTPLTGHASENGTIVFPLGVHTVLNGFTVEPGQNRFYNYTMFYTANRLNDSDGKKIPVDAKLAILVDAIRIDHGWQAKLGDFTLSSGIVGTFVDASVKINGDKSKTDGFGNLTFKPIILGSANESGTFFQGIYPLDFEIPTGSYDKNRGVNAAVHYYSWEPSYGYTWFPNSKIEVSGTLSASISSTNRDTDYRSGNNIHYEQIVGYSLTPDIQIGLQGYYFKQITDDELDGRKFQDGNRGQAAAFGPQIRYTIKPGTVVAAKYQHEVAVQNRSEGDKFWVQFSFPF